MANEGGGGFRSNSPAHLTKNNYDSEDANANSELSTAIKRHLSISDMTLIRSKTYKYELIRDIRKHIQPPTKGGLMHLCRDTFTYFHYGCDGVNDVGWGCAYRTLQTMCSWVLQKQCRFDTPIPSIKEIQTCLVKIGDKPPTFLDSKEWIGSMEICFALETLYDVTCKILHYPIGKSLMGIKSDIVEYYNAYGGFVMMGGDKDAASKGIAGVHITDDNLYFLIVDPHCSEIPTDVNYLLNNGYVSWKSANDFNDSSFYNFCLPRL